MIADLVLEDMKKNSGTFPEKNSFIAKK